MFDPPVPCISNLVNLFAVKGLVVRGLCNWLFQAAIVSIKRITDVSVAVMKEVSAVPGALMRQITAVFRGVRG